MNTYKPSARDFSVFQFSLTIGTNGQPVQHATPHGTFSSVERAFESARRLAQMEFMRLQRPGVAKADSAPVELVDTEWGYDLRRGWLVVSRFWVHDAYANCPIGAE